MPITKMTSENFKSITEGCSEPILIDFFAPWCSPCRMLSPIIDEISETAETVKICKVNIDEQPDLANQFNVMSIPTLIVFKDGQKVNESVGLVAKEKIEELIK